ncbi:MAG TPA: hypothetical protein VLB67_11295 [Acidimicrobiia bacterium]|nr:hypothetical protein [Acidimicrobiia bacterium]
MTYGRPPLEKIDLHALARLEACPSARGPGSQLPRQVLERWKAVRDASVEWHHSGRDPDAIDRIEQALFGAWDPVQRRLLSELFSAYRRLFPRDAAAVDLDPPPGVAIHDDTNRTISVAVQADVVTGEGVQAIRIKTGRSVTGEVEAAAFYHSDEQRTLVDLRLMADDIVTVGPPADPVGIVDDAARRWDAALSAPRNGRTAGFHCHTCHRPARCGQYPVVGEGTVTSGTRTLLISKSRLAALASCLRAAAWPAIYSIPRDDGEEDDLPAANLVVGNQFHRSVAAALLSDDAGAIYEAAYGTVSPSEVEDLRWLFDQHEALWTSDEPPVVVTRTEYQFGATFVVDGSVLDRRDRLAGAPVAVTFTAVTDVNGWEDDRVAAVVEHRTGRASDAHPYEADLYAVSAWSALHSMQRAVDGVAVHFHHVRADPAMCDRRFYTLGEIEQAAERLRTVARELASLHPADAAAPEFTVGPWCERCNFVLRCSAHRV